MPITRNRRIYNEQIKAIGGEKSLFPAKLYYLMLEQQKELIDYWKCSCAPWAYEYYFARLARKYLSKFSEEMVEILQKRLQK